MKVGWKTIKMTYKEIKKYLYGGCIVRNNKYEYKISRFSYLYTRNIGCLAWNIIKNIPENEKEQDWEIVQ